MYHTHLNTHHRTNCKIVPRLKHKLLNLKRFSFFYNKSPKQIHFFFHLQVEISTRIKIWFNKFDCIFFSSKNWYSFSIKLNIKKNVQTKKKRFFFLFTQTKIFKLASACEWYWTEPLNGMKINSVTYLQFIYSSFQILYRRMSYAENGTKTTASFDVENIETMYNALHLWECQTNIYSWMKRTIN